MLKSYLSLFFMSMIPVFELRGAIPFAVGWKLPLLPSYLICILGNLIPVPLIYYFARKVLIWGSGKKVIGPIFSWLLQKGERGGRKLTARAGRGGLFVALMLFVGIPLPGTGAWTGTLAASILDMGWKATFWAVCLGVMLAGIVMAVMALASMGVFSVIGL